MTTAFADLTDLNARLKQVRTVWQNLVDALRSLVSEWKRANVALERNHVEYLPELDAQLSIQGGVLELRTGYGEVALRANDPVGHISAHFQRSTSFGCDHVLVLYKCELTEGGPATLFRVDDQQFLQCSVEDILTTIKLNLLEPKVMPLRIRVAMEKLNSAATSS